ncbi:MAG: PGF-CTERM sorting domain-containing protein [Archaeoglobaceae archaeon]
MRKEVEKMKKFGLIGLMLLVILATPAMAQLPLNVNGTELKLTNVEMAPTSYEAGSMPTVKLTFQNTNASTPLKPTLVLVVKNVTTLSPGITKMLSLDLSAHCEPANGINMTTGEVLNNTTTVTCILNSTAMNSLFSNLDPADYVFVANNTTKQVAIGFRVNPQPKDEPSAIDPDLTIDYAKLSTRSITYGEVISIDLVYGYYPKQWGTRYVAIVEYNKYLENVLQGQAWSSDTVRRALTESVWYYNLTEDAGRSKFDINSASVGMVGGLYYVVLLFDSSGQNYTADMFFRVVSVTGKPKVSISVTPTSAAVGDRVKLSYSMDASEPFYVGVIATGWGGERWFANCSGNTWTNDPRAPGVFQLTSRLNQDSQQCPDYFELTPRHNFTNATEGVIVFKIAAAKTVENVFEGQDPYRAEAVATVILSKPKLSSISVPSKHVNGTDFTVTGVTNVAPTWDIDFDVGLPNMVTLTILSLDNQTQCGGRVFSGVIGADRTFSIKIDNFGARPPCVLRTGYYKAEFRLETDTGITADPVTTIFEVVNGMVKISPDKTTVVRGDEIKFTIITNLKVNSQVFFIILNDRIAADGTINNGDDRADEVTRTLAVDATGKAYFTLRVAQNAPLTEYRFKAQIRDNEGRVLVEDTISVSVVKQTLDLTVDRTTVCRGGELRFTGTSTADAIYVYANEENVFRFSQTDIAMLPDDSILDTNDELSTAIIVPDTNDKLDFKIDVIAQESGTYYLYFYAQTTAGRIDKSSDPQKVFAIVVTDPRIVSVEIPSRVPYMGEVEVKVTFDVGNETLAQYSWLLEGPNKKVRPNQLGWDNDWRGVPSTLEETFRLNLANYIEGAGANRRPLEPGLYVFTMRLRYDGDEVDKVQKLIEISTIKMDVTIEPETIVVGDQIKVTVQTDREGIAGYSNIWVTMVGVNYKAPQQVTLDSSGKGSVTFETIGLADGTYKFYVRDTMGTGFTGQQLADMDMYDLDPADTAARAWWAHDDLLVIKTVQILKEKPTVTTPPPTTPPVTTPEVTPTTPPPTTVVTTPPPTTTPAPGPIPGFEAIFAIAGLIAVAYLLRKRQ